MMQRVTFCVVLCLAMQAGSWSAETDQYMTWDIELADCSEAMNRFMNEEMQQFLKGVNARTRPITSGEELTVACYQYFFQGLHSSRIRHWANTSPEVERYPDRSVGFFEYQRMSVNRGFSFPYILPMARTVRIGDVYLGTDKIGHFFGFGRRYFQRYVRHIAEGMGEEEAMEKIVRWGLHVEESMVGKLVDGIFSHADMEANFQGFLFARDLCIGEDPCIVREEEAWVQVRPVDMVGYMSPDMDESYNCSHYWLLRKKNVLPILKEEYCEKYHSERVQKRFARYREFEPSLSQRVIAEHYTEKGKNPQDEQNIHVLCAETELAAGQ